MRPRNRALIALVVIIAIAAGAYLLRGESAGLRDRGAALLAPGDVQGMSFLYRAATSSSRVSVASIRRSGIEPVEALNAYGSIESVARTDSGFVAIARPLRSLSVDIVRVNGTVIETLESSTAEKRAIAASSDGAYIAWSEAAEQGDVPYTAATDTWKVQVRLPDGTVRTLGTGFGPQFLNAETMLFTAPESLLMVALPGGQPERLPFPGAQSIAVTAKASPSMLLVPLPDSSAYFAYRILSVRPFTTERLGELTQSFHDVVIGEDALYGLRTEEGRQEAVRLPFGSLQDLEPVFAFPTRFSITSLIP